MSRVIQDNPSGWSRSLPGHTVEYSSGFAQPFYYGTVVAVSAGSTGEYELEIDNDDYIYFIDVVNCTPQVYKEFSAIVYFNDDPYVAGCFQGYCNIPLRQNPSIQLITGDKIKVVVTNLDSVSRNFLIKLNGTKIVRPSDFGKVPTAYFTKSAGPYIPGSDVSFTDASTYQPTSWEWDFGDGSDHSHLQNPTHHYDSVGSYTVVLTATNAYGSDVYSSVVEVVEDLFVDFTEWTEIDPGSQLTIDVDHVHATALPNNVESYIYHDYGVNYFDAIDLQFEIVQSAHSGSPAYIYMLYLYNSIDDFVGGSGLKMVVYFSYTTPTLTLYFGMFNNLSDLSLDSMVASEGVTYYCTLTRASGGTTATLKVYSDSERTVLVDTLSISHADVATKFRYAYVLGSCNIASSNTVTAQLSNLVVST